MDLDKMLEAALKNVLPQGEMVSKADVEAMFASLKTELTGAVDEMVRKALPLDREGVGRKEVVKTPEEAAQEEFEADPAAFLVRKGEAVSAEEKSVATALFKKVMGEGLK